MKVLFIIIISEYILPLINFLLFTIVAMNTSYYDLNICQAKIVDIVNKDRFYPVSVVYISMTFRAVTKEMYASQYLQLFIVGIP
jgi:hypothetical protein